MVWVAKQWRCPDTTPLPWAAIVMVAWVLGLFNFVVASCLFTCVLWGGCWVGIRYVFPGQCGRQMIVWWIVLLASCVIGYDWWSWLTNCQLLEQSHTVTGRLLSRQPQRYGTRIMMRVDGRHLHGWHATRVALHFKPSQAPKADVAQIVANVQCRRYHSPANGLYFDGLWYGWSRYLLGGCRVQSWRPTAIDHGAFSLRDRLLHALHRPPLLHYEGMFRALVLGDTRRVRPETRALLQQTGTAHLVAVSGLHIGLVALCCGHVAKWLWRLGLRWFWRCHQQAFVAIGRVAGAAGYTWLSGAAVSSCRAFWMVCVCELAWLMRWRAHPYMVWLVAAMILLLWTPSLVAVPSFWLSVMAVACLMSSRSAHVQQDGVLEWLSTIWRLNIGMLPLYALCVFPVGILSIWVNAWAIPLFSVLVPCVLLVVGLLPWCQWMHHVLVWLDGVLAFFFNVLHWVVTHSHVTTFITSASWPQWLCVLWVSASCFVGRCATRRWLLGLVGFVGYVLLAPKIAPGQIRWTVLDVGQGLSVLIQTQQHQLLYDAGPPGMGHRVVVPYLRQQGIHALDAVVISHRDQDHMGGLQALSQTLPIRALWAPRGHQLIPGMHANVCGQPYQWQWDGVRFMFLNHPDIRSKHRNSHSCVLRVVGRHGAILLPGDLDEVGERDVLQRGAKRTIQSDVLVVGHHGSRSSSSAVFLAAVQPKLALVSAGDFRRFHHPSPAVMARLHRQHTITWNTHDMGAISGSLNLQQPLHFARQLPADAAWVVTHLWSWLRPWLMGMGTIVLQCFGPVWFAFFRRHLYLGAGANAHDDTER